MQNLQLAKCFRQDWQRSVKATQTGSGEFGPRKPQFYKGDQSGRCPAGYRVWLEIAGPKGPQEIGLPMVGGGASFNARSGHGVYLRRVRGPFIAGSRGAAYG